MRIRRASSPLKMASIFLGFHIRRYRNGKLLIKPGKAAVRRFRERLTTEMMGSARGQRSGGDPQAQPGYPGLGCLLPDGGVQEDLRPL